MRRTSPFPYPVCHMAHVPGPGEARAAVWICEYPYRTMRMHGPSTDCVDCPVWQAMHPDPIRPDDDTTHDTLMAS